MKIRQKTKKLTKSEKPSTSGQRATREKSRVRWNNIYADKTEHEREKLREAERKRMTYALKAMNYESYAVSLEKWREKKNQKAKKKSSTQVSAISQFVIIALIYNTCPNW